jgi:hypothetical protein
MLAVELHFLWMAIEFDARQVSRGAVESIVATGDESVGPATPADRAGASSPMELTRTTRVAPVPASRHSRFLQRSPSFSATARNSWFMIRVCACTIRGRCQSNCRRSRFSPLGTQIRGKRSSSNNRKISSASWRSVFCFRTRFVRISAASPIHNSNRNSPSSRSNQRAWPLAS